MDNRSFSTSSTFSSSSSSGTSSIQTPVKVLSSQSPTSASNSSAQPQQRAKPRADHSDNVFNFGESRVREYLSSLSSSSSSSDDQPLDSSSLPSSPLCTSRNPLLTESAASIPLASAQCVLSPVPRKNKCRAVDSEPCLSLQSDSVEERDKRERMFSADTDSLSLLEGMPKDDTESDNSCLIISDSSIHNASPSPACNNRSRARKGGRALRIDLCESSTSSLSETRQGPLTRSQKRKLAESSSNSPLSSSEDDQVPKRRRPSQGKHYKGGRQRLKKERIPTIDID